MYTQLFNETSKHQILQNEFILYSSHIKIVYFKYIINVFFSENILSKKKDIFLRNFQVKRKTEQLFLMMYCRENVYRNKKRVSRLQNILNKLLQKYIIILA